MERPQDEFRRKVAVALRYRRSEDPVPVVTASGHGQLAERILELAKQNHVPIKEDAELAHALGQVGVDRQIPSELYEAVAEVISFVYSLRPKVTG